MRTSTALRAMSSKVVLYFLIAVSSLQPFLSSCSSSNETETPANECYYDFVSTRAALPAFENKMFWSPDSSGPRLDIYVSVRESRLRFNKDSNLFVASYSCTVRLSGSGDTPISKEVDRKVVLQDYPRAEEQFYDAFIVSLPTGSGKHDVQITVTDNESAARSTRRYTEDIPQVADKPILLSDVMFLARFDTAGQGRRITPFIPSNVGLLSDTLRFFSILSSRMSSSDSVTYSVYGLRSSKPILPAFNMQVLSNQATGLNPCSSDIDTILLYRHEVNLVTKKGISSFIGEVPKPPTGNYLLRLVVKDSSGEVSSAMRAFEVHDRGFPQVSDNLSTMVGSLNYIANPGEVKKIVAEKSDSSVKANLIEFWKDHGGLGKMVQYYARVAQSNQLFTDCVEGWKTPMGMFFIVCGAPDNVECEGIWNERWSYYQSSGQASMSVSFRLAEDTPNIEDRFYGVEQIYSTADLWSYYVNQWRVPY